MLNKQEVQEIFTKIKKFIVLNHGEDIAELEKDIERITSSYIEALDELNIERGRMFLGWDVDPIKFHRYRSGVLARFLEMDLNAETEKLRKELLQLFNHAGIKATDDNKIVFECEVKGKKVYFGFFDLKFSIGFGYYDDNERGV